MRTHKLDGLEGFWVDYDNLRISGFSYEIKDGSVFEIPMESGKIGLYKLKNLRRMNDPRDQYFANLEPWKYKGE